MRSLEIFRKQIKRPANCMVTIFANDTQGFMEIIKIFLRLIHYFFFSIFILQTNSALAQKTSPFQGSISIPAIESHLSIGLPKLIKELTEHYPFEVSYLSKTLEIPFVVITGPVWMPFHKADAAVNLSDGARIAGVTFLQNRDIDDVDVTFVINGSCVTQQEINAQLGDLVLITVQGEPFIFPRGGSSLNFGDAKKIETKKNENEIFGIKKIEHGFVKIFFSEKSLCLTRFKLRSHLGKYELKKLEETDMRTPEEVPKKPVSKP